MRVLAITAFFAFGITGFAQTISTPADLIAAMHQRYSGAWYRTLTFTQQSVTHKADGTKTTEIWHEKLLLPGHLRIDIGESGSGNGMLFADNQLYTYRDGKPVNRRPYVHPLLVLGSDIYTQAPKVTLQQLHKLNFNLSLMHEEKLDGRAMYVVGAAKGDLKSRQFWIDKDRLLFVRLLEPSEEDPETIQDVRFDDYKEVQAGGWLAEHVEVFAHGKLVFEEKYSDVRTDPPLNDGLFDPKQFAREPTAPGQTN